MVYIEATRGQSAVTLRRDVGSRIPLATTSMGRALLCALPQNERDFLMDHIRLRNEEQWPKVKAGIEQAFRITRIMVSASRLANGKRPSAPWACP
jgi:DNA-binding IclR family transcriptional regulator